MIYQDCKTSILHKGPLSIWLYSTYIKIYNLQAEQYILLCTLCKYSTMHECLYWSFLLCMSVLLNARLLPDCSSLFTKFKVLCALQKVQTLLLCLRFWSASASMPLQCRDLVSKQTWPTHSFIYVDIQYTQIWLPVSFSPQYSGSSDTAWCLRSA